MKAFVATSLRNKKEACRVIEILNKHSIDVQSCINEEGSLLDQELFEHNFQGIKDADIFISIYKNIGSDVSAEIGMAYALGKKMLAIAYEEDTASVMPRFASGEMIREEDLSNFLDRIYSNPLGDRLNFYVPDLSVYGPSVLSDLSETFYTQKFVDGPNVKKFEDVMSRRYSRHVVAMSSGTSGLITSLDSMLGKKKEVLVPSLTFIATIQAILHAGGRPVYVDVDKDTWTMNIEDAESKVTDNTGVILPVNLFGVPCDVEGIRKFSERYDIKVLYDSCQAFGSSTTYGEVGCFGDAEVFSLDVTKALSGALGGYVTIANGDLAKKIRSAKNFGNSEDRVPNQRGINSRMLEFSASLALHHLYDSDSNIKYLRGLAERYKQYLSSVQNISFQMSREYEVVTPQYFAILLDYPEEGMAQKARIALDKKGIETRAYIQKMIHREPIFSEFQYSLPVTERIGTNILCLPMHRGVEESHIKTMAETLGGILI